MEIIFHLWKFFCGPENKRRVNDFPNFAYDHPKKIERKRKENG